MIILASASARRRELLEKAGIDFIADAADAAESSDAADPYATIAYNAFVKAASVCGRHPGSWVVGADTAIIFRHRIYGKPENLNAAKRMLAEFSGHGHEVVTAVAVLRQEADLHPLVGARFSEISQVYFKAINAADIDAYCGKVEVLDKAGSYALQEHGDMLIDRFTGSADNIIGLPVGRLLRALRALPK